MKIATRRCSKRSDLQTQEHDRMLRRNEESLRQAYMNSFGEGVQLQSPLDVGGDRWSANQKGKELPRDQLTRNADLADKEEFVR